MAITQTEVDQSIEGVLGYLNYSSGTHDPNFFEQLDTIYQHCTQHVEITVSGNSNSDVWCSLFRLLKSKLKSLSQTNSHFAATEQAALVLSKTEDEILPGYLKFHADLLFHQSTEFLFSSFFIGVSFQCVLSELHRMQGAQVICGEKIISKLNDYVGYRPVAVLENGRKMEPYPHEWCRPVPIFIRGAGVASGMYTELICQALEILRTVPPAISSMAQFDLGNLQELAIDPRPYDFDHPVNKRPNYQFGLWDPLSVDNRGFFSRFVVQQVTLDILMQRVHAAVAEDRAQKLTESAAALAGTILMSSAISGRGPDAHSSDVTLGNLLPNIAECRDAFYSHLLTIEDPWGAKLAAKIRKEAAELKQPFAGVRRYLNSQLSRRRARQLEQSHLAALFAKIGRPREALLRDSTVPSVSTRILSALECVLTDIESSRGSERSAQVASQLEKTVEILKRGIDCGALVDPWNVIGFDSNFSLFPAMENSVPDHRIGVLIEMVKRVFGQFASGLCIAAAEKNREAVDHISNTFSEFASWWDQFATEWAEDGDAVLGGAIYEDAKVAANALAAWQQAGATAGNVRFWQPFVEQLDSPMGYELIINALLDHQDFVAAMNLLMHWLSQHDHMSFQKGSGLFHVVANRWLNEILCLLDHSTDRESEDVWETVVKFFDFLEANADIYGEVPDWELTDTGSDQGENAVDSMHDSTDEIYSAAYDEVVYRDSTDDGIDGSIIGSGEDAFGLAEEARRLSDRLGFLVTTTRLWKYVVVTAMASGGKRVEALHERFKNWLDQSSNRQKRFIGLLKAIERCDLPHPLPNSESLVEYDRNRAIHEVLLDRVTDACLANIETIQVLSAAVGDHITSQNAADNRIALLIRASVKQDITELKKQAALYDEELPQQNLLYIPVAKGGHSVEITKTKNQQRSLKLALDILPRMGLLNETLSLLRCCAESERSQIGSPGCVTEFDQVFYVSNQQLIESVVMSVKSWNNPAEGESQPDGESRDKLLIEYLQQLVEHTAELWLEHSQTLRLSVLEKVYGEKKWNALANFIQAHGNDIFTQSFLHLGNLRAILHRGVSLWLEEKVAASDQEMWSLFSVMDNEENKRHVVSQLQIIIEAIVENYGEYREYNGTTTQSDRGAMLYKFLDMLRLRSSYDRVAWNLVPAIQVHEILLRHDCIGAAESWRLEIMQRTTETATEMLRKLRAMETRYGMRLSTIAHRLEERFIRPLEIDRAKVLLRKCVHNTAPQEVWFPLLEEQINELAQEPTGAGLDLPQWIATLEDEVRQYKENHFRGIREDITEKIPRRLLLKEYLEKELQRLG